jgi:CRISPR-associated protein Cas2
VLSGYRLVWLIVLFDLPVGTKKERKRASTFRDNLVTMGFEMVQFSVYMKFGYGKEQAETIIENVKKQVPDYGNVKILRITDKQFAQIIHLGDQLPGERSHRQLALF